jgi:hypothetical protein
MFRITKTLDRLHPRKPHYYAAFVGTDVTRAGVGHLLVRRLLDEADERGLPIYAETLTPLTFEWTRRFGFTVLHEDTEIFPGGPRTSILWREAREKGMTQSQMPPPSEKQNTVLGG